MAIRSLHHNLNGLQERRDQRIAERRKAAKPERPKKPIPSPSPAQKRAKASFVPQYLAWFSKLPTADRAAIKKAYEQAKKMKATLANLP